MYSLLLMSALTAGPDTASFGGKFASCHGCCGVPVSCYGCCGYSYGCCGYSYGCCGGGGLFHRWHAHKSCHGCCGGAAYVTSCYGCCGGACWGNPYGSYYGAYPAWGGSGCFGYGIVVGDPVVVGSTTDGIPGLASIAPAGTTTSTSEKPATASARLTIELPAAAKLYVDGKATKGDGTSRQFHTPPLPTGQEFYYEMRAEVEVDGKLEFEEKRVVVRAGEAITESFPKLAAVLTAKAGDAVAANK